MNWTLSRYGQAARVGQAFVLLWCLWLQKAGAGESPLEVIRTTTQQARAVLDDPAYQGAAQRKPRVRKMWDVLLPHFDQPAIAQGALGLHWRGLTQEQRARFTDLFLQLVQHSYSSTLDRYTADAEFFFDTERIDGEDAEVYTRIVTAAQPDAFSVVYHLHQKEGQWLVFDLVAENVNIVRNYRTQFDRIITRSSFEGLIQTLEDKLAELAAA